MKFQIKLQIQVENDLNVNTKGEFTISRWLSKYENFDHIEDLLDASDVAADVWDAIKRLGRYETISIYLWDDKRVVNSVRFCRYYDGIRKGIWDGNRYIFDETPMPKPKAKKAINMSIAEITENANSLYDTKMMEVKSC